MAEYFWDTMYAKDGYRYGTRPSGCVEEAAALLEPGSRVLCVGDGEGRNGVWLASRGHEVTSVEPSAVGIEKARSLAREVGARMRWVEAFFPTPELGDERFDLVALVYVHTAPEDRRALHVAAAERLASGGVLLVEGFHTDQIALDRRSGGPRRSELLFTEELLAADLEGVEGIEVESCEKLELELRAGKAHRGLASVVRVIARRID